MTGLPPVIVVTGTDTDVGKTVTTAALAAVLPSPVAVYKPAQTGTPVGTTGDIDQVRHLAGISDGYEGTRLEEPLSPATAATRGGITLPSIAEHAKRVDELVATGRRVLVEGAGGLLVELDGSGGNLAGLAGGLASPCGFLVVCRAGLGTLNHAQLTVEALRSRRLTLLGVVIGSWPTEPDLASSCNLDDLPRVTGTSLLGRIPAGAGRLRPSQFQSRAAGWFAPPLGTGAPGRRP
jgi:dethiobiotin synthetase